jgi:hypothetical protein
MHSPVCASVWVVFAVVEDYISASAGVSAACVQKMASLKADENAMSLDNSACPTPLAPCTTARPYPAPLSVPTR